MSEQALGWRLREHQERVLAYQGGRMAVSAVPGSGKTLTLALLAAKLIVEGRLGDESEVLVVTVQNSAVDNIAQRIREVLRARGLAPMGFRVCTLHKLASDILRQRLDLAGMEEDWVIIDEPESARHMHTAAEAWIGGHRVWWESFLPADSEERRRKAAESWRRETERVGREITKLCKHLRLPPEAALALLDAHGEGPGLTRMGVELYAQYHRYLWARGGLDFDDLIWRAIDALDQDVTFVQNLRRRWPFILEDEAQDSSPLQEHILDRLSGREGNWVRVGDPNQAINSTFTAANPRYFRRFARRIGVMLLPQSGRCGRPIIRLANHLVHWVTEQHPQPLVREMAFQPQDIQPTGPDDPQQNPPDDECHIHIREKPFPETQVEAERVAAWAAHYVTRHPACSVAILCPTGPIGVQVVEALGNLSDPAPFDDLLRTTPQARNVANLLAQACEYLSDPTNRGRLKALHGALAKERALGATAGSDARREATLLRSITPQDLLFPHYGHTVRDALPPNVEIRDAEAESLTRFAALAARWVRALALPIDQLILTIAQDLFVAEQELAICHTLANSLRAVSALHPTWRLADFAHELRAVAHEGRRLNELSLSDAGYVPQAGRIAVTTMHKAKGLEWDAVYLVSVDSLEFPSSPDDAFRDEMYFMPGVAPAAEARTRLEQLAKVEFAPGEELSATEASRLEYIAERMRLLYVCITRAKRDLCLTWSESRGAGKTRVEPASALLELKTLIASSSAEEVDA